MIRKEEREMGRKGTGSGNKGKGGERREVDFGPRRNPGHATGKGGQDLTRQRHD